MTEREPPPPPFRYGEPPPLGTSCEYEACRQTAVVTLQTPELSQRLCATHHDLVIDEMLVLAEMGVVDMEPVARDREEITPEYLHNSRGETLMEIEQITAFLEGRGAFPVGGFVDLEGMSPAAVRERAPSYLAALHDYIELIDQMLDLRKGRPSW